MNSKILFLNGSPNKSGHSMTLAQAIFKGVEYDVIHAYDMMVTSCDDCKVCHHKPTCKYDDDIDLILKAIDACETLVVVTPVYFGAMTDRLMQIFNRFQMVFEKKITHKLSTPTVKNIILVSTAGDTEKRMFEGVNLTTSILSSLFDSLQPLHFYAYDTDQNHDLKTTMKESIKVYQETIKKLLISH